MAKRLLSLPAAAAALLLVLAGGFGLQRSITGGAFDSLERLRVADQAQRLRIALDYEAELLRRYGATNSIWDNSHDDLAHADAAAFAADFPPGDLHGLYGVDGAIGISPEGRVVVGGLVANDAFVPLPAGLTEPATLDRLYDPAAAAGTARCGTLNGGDANFVFCGFPSYRGDSTGRPAGGLVFLKSLDRSGLTTLGRSLGMRLTLERGGTFPRPDRVAGTLGRLEFGTRMLDDDHVAFEVGVPSVNGDPLVLSAVSDRVVNRTASHVANRMIALVVVLAVAVLGFVGLLVQRGVSRAVRPLRVLTEEVVRSGDRSLRVAGRRRGEIGALADALNDMLDTLAAHDGRLLQEQQQREQQLRSSTLRQRLSNRYIRTRAQAMIDDTATVVVAELKDIAEQGVAVRDSVDRIDDRVRNTGETTQRLVEQARAADVASAAVADSLHRVGRIAKMIGDVAEQTNLLALNASIEAARAGAAGRGFTVVANEVKALARTTAESTQEIADSVAAVETDAMAMAGALLALTGEITRINDEAALLDTVAAGQRAAMAELDVTVTDAIRRIDGMASVTDLIERRQFERVPSAGTVGLRIGRSTVTGDLLDLSAGGLRCITGTGTSVREGAQVLVELPIGPPGEQLRATVVRCRDHPAGRDLGLQFVNLPAQHQLAIDTYINDLFLLRDAEADAA